MRRVLGLFTVRHPLEVSQPGVDDVLPRRPLGQRPGDWLLRTAYCTDKSGRIAQLRKERDAFRRANP